MVSDPSTDLMVSEDAEDTPTRANAGVALRIAGASWSDIARTVGYSSAHRARQAVERALADTADDPEDRAAQRNLADRRLNRLLQSVMGKAVDPMNPDQIAFNRQALALVDRIARLHGVDAPTAVEYTTPSAERVAQVVGQVIGLIRTEQAAEADIIDAEIVED